MCSSAANPSRKHAALAAFSITLAPSICTRRPPARAYVCKARVQTSVWPPVSSQRHGRNSYRQHGQVPGAITIPSDPDPPSGAGCDPRRGPEHLDPTALPPRQKLVRHPCTPLARSFHHLFQIHTKFILKSF
eukprot:9466368-Pyramimonas_sp.AAC.1